MRKEKERFVSEQVTVKPHKPKRQHKEERKQALEKRLKMENSLQKEKGFMIPRSTFRKAIAVKTQTVGEFRWERAASNVVQEALELHLTSLMGKAYLISQFGKNVTLTSQEMKIMHQMQNLFMQKLAELPSHKPVQKAIKAKKEQKAVCADDGAVADEEQTLGGETEQEGKNGESAKK